MLRSRIVALLIGLSLCKSPLQAQLQVPDSLKTPATILADFMNLRFGMFIHWGPVTLRGTEIGWSRNQQVVQADYDSLYREFNPVLYNPEAWVKTARDAGMKYLTITAKHHDGFCLWPSRYTNYNIAHAPFKKDVIGELAKACKKYGIKFCIYYSVLDWYHPDYPLHHDGNKTPDSKADMGRYSLYMKKQLKELITAYHPYMLWFDGNWEEPWTQEMAVDMYNYIKGLDRKVIINNRLGKTAHKELTASTVGDYATPEQMIGEINMKDPWESCITICKQWSWKPNDQMKSLKQCIQTLSRTAAGNGNLLFNLGPMPDGRMENRQVQRLKEIGQWLEQNKDAVYGTKGGPYKPDSVLAATRKANRIYLHVYSSSQNQLVLPAIPGKKVLKAYFLQGKAIAFENNESTIRIRWEGNLPDANCSIIVMEMDGDTETIPLIERSKL